MSSATRKKIEYSITHNVSQKLANEHYEKIVGTVEKINLD